MPTKSKCERRYGFIGKITVPRANEIYDAYETVGIGVTNIINEMQKNN